jgi:hypothetical protein
MVESGRVQPVKANIPKEAARALGLEVVGDQTVITLASRDGDLWEVTAEETEPAETEDGEDDAMPAPIAGSDNPALGALPPAGPGYLST